MQRRPAPVNVFGILNIAFSVMMIFSLLFLIASFFLGDMPVFRDNPAFKMARDYPAYKTIQEVSVILGIPSTLVLLMAGVGLLKLKSWGRTLSIFYGFYAILQSLGLGVANYFVLLRPMLETHVNLKDPQAMGEFFGAIFGTLAGCLGIIYPILLIIFMNRRSVIDALRAGPGAGPPPMPMR
jgi:hypothetical protein